MKTKKKLAAEIERLRKDLMVIRGQLDALQAVQLRNAFANSFLGNPRWTWPTTVGLGGLRTPVMGSVWAPADYWD
jgi:hypothetical protein